MAYIKSSSSKRFLYKKHRHCCIYAFPYVGCAGDKGDMKSTTSYLTFVRGNPVIWKSKKQDVMFRKNIEADYWAMAHIACELL